MPKFRVNAELAADGSRFFSTMYGAENAVKRFGRAVSAGITSRLAGFLSVAGLTMFVRKVIDYADRLTDLSERTGVAVETLQRLDRAAKLHGTTIETLVTFWDRLNKARAAALKNPESAQARGFGALGVTPAELRAKSAEDITRKIALKFQTTANVESLIAPLMAVGGRGVGQLVAFFREGLDAMTKDTRVMSAETADQLHDLNNQVNELGRQIMADTAPLILRVVGAFRQLWLWGTQVVMVLGHFGKVIGSIAGNLYGMVTGGQSWKAGWQDVADAWEEDLAQLQGQVKKSDEDYAKEMADEAARRAARIKGRTPTGPLVFEPFDVKAAKAEHFTTPTDALVAVGNFLGTGRNALQAIGQRQITLLERIEQNTRPEFEPAMDEDFF